LKQAEINGEVNKRKAEADLAYDLQKYKTNQSLKKEEIEIEIVSKEQEIQVQDREVQRRERELQATVAKQADAERYKLQALAEAEKYRLETEAKGAAEAQRVKGLAEADVIRATGEAEAQVIQKKGLAEAEVMRIKADAWKQYGEAAIAQMFVEKLPELARAISEPLSKTDKIVVVSNGDGAAAGASKITGDVTRIISQLPPIIESLTGLNLEKVLSRAVGQDGTSETPADKAILIKPTTDGK